MLCEFVKSIWFSCRRNSSLLSYDTVKFPVCLLLCFAGFCRYLLGLAALHFRSSYFLVDHLSSCFFSLYSGPVKSAIQFFTFYYYPNCSWLSWRLNLVGRPALLLEPPRQLFFFCIGQFWDRVPLYAVGPPWAVVLLLGFPVQPKPQPRATVPSHWLRGGRVNFLPTLAWNHYPPGSPPPMQPGTQTWTAMPGLEFVSLEKFCVFIFIFHLVRLLRESQAEIQDTEAVQQEAMV
jgi:hypothetical protein